MRRGILADVSAGNRAETEKLPEGTAKDEVAPASRRLSREPARSLPKGYLARGFAYLVDELVVDDRRRQPAALFLGLQGILGTHHAPLAYDVAVLLSGNLFRHLKHHLDQRVNRKLLRSAEQHSALADVFDNSFVPRAGLVDAVAQRNVELQPARPRYPRRPLLPGVAASNVRLRLGMLHSFGAAHGCPVVLIFRRAQQADLVVVAVATTARPGKLVRAAPKHKHIHKFLWHGVYFRVDEPSDAGSSSREDFTLDRLLSCTSGICRNVNDVNAIT